MIVLDVNKAFNTLSWPYLIMVLCHYDFGTSFLSWVLALYNSPQAKINQYGFESSLFPIRRGTRQGCPLSPLLFILALEPSKEVIHSHPGHNRGRSVLYLAQDIDVCRRYLDVPN